MQTVLKLSPRFLDSEITQQNNAARAVSAVQALLNARTVLKVDHEGYKHSAYDWWIFDPRTSSPKTCDVCNLLVNQSWRGDIIPFDFPYHTHQAVNAIRAMVHPYCRCRLRWAGRSDKIYNTPLGILLPMESREISYPSEKELEKLSPSQRAELEDLLYSPWEL